MFRPFEEKLFTLDELIELCVVWQNELRLEDWTVALRICRESELNRGNCSGNCSWELGNHYALISIIDSVDYPESPFKYDMEVVLVHELLHLKACYFDSFEDSSLEHKMLETAIDTTARALVGLRRKAEKITDKKGANKK